MGMERYYITTPIYYVNSTPHIGHAYTTIAADILARNRRQRGAETFFLTGVDEHAAKVARVAAEQGLSPQDYADQIAVVWRELPERLNASNDFFIRTSDEEHKRFVQGFLQKLYDNGHVYQDVYAGLYCVGCEAFKTEADLVDGKCPEHDREPEWIEERNWFFRLSSFQRAAARAVRAADFVQPGFRANEARSFIEGGLQDFSISRAGQTWGIPIPWDPDSVAYVWADALVNYLSALTYARPGEDLVETFWPSVRHLLAKDILRFHCVYWPAMLLAAGYEPPHQLFVHGYLLLDDRKISKSLGNVVDPLDLIDVYGTDPVRFWCARAVSFGQDGAASIAGIHERYERELGNDLGNLLSRTTAMVARYRGGTLRAVPRRTGASQRRSRPLARRRRRSARRLRRHRGAGADLGGRARAQPRGRDDRAVAAGEGRSARGRARPRPLRPRRRPPCRRGRAVRLRSRHGGRDPVGARAARRASTGRSSPTGSQTRPTGSRRPAALPAARRSVGVITQTSRLLSFRAVAFKPLWLGMARFSPGRAIPRCGCRRRTPSDPECTIRNDRHARPPRRVRRACRVPRRACPRRRRLADRHDRHRDRILPGGARDRRRREGRLRRARDRPAPGRQARTPRGSASSSSCSSTRGPSPSVRPGSTTSTTSRRATCSAPLFDRQLEIARFAGPPGRDPHARRGRRHGGRPGRVPRHRDPPLLLGSRAAGDGDRARATTSRSRGT